MSLRVYTDLKTNTFVLVKATNFDELQEQFFKYFEVVGANFYVLEENKKIGSLITSTHDISNLKRVYATDLEDIPTSLPEMEFNKKDTRNKKFYDDTGKSRNRVERMRVIQGKLEKSLRELKKVREINIKEKAKENKNFTRYTGKNITKPIMNELIDDNVKEILLVQTQLKTFAMEKLHRTQKKYLMKNRS